MTVLLILASLLPAAPPATGLWQVDLATGAATRLGGYRGPSIDPVGRYLYADDRRGNLVRWSLESVGGAPQVVVRTEPGEPPWMFPQAAPAGGLLAATRLDRFRDTAGERVRVTLGVFDAQTGQQLAGPLPLCLAKDIPHPTLAAVWHPNGETLAFWITEGRPAPGLYLFSPRTRDWYKANASAAPPRPLPVLRFQPNGRSLSYVEGPRLVLRGGASYGVFRSFEVTQPLHTWIDDEQLGLLDPQQGITLLDLEGHRGRRLTAWRGSTPFDSSLPASLAGDLLWVGPAPGATAGQLGLWTAPAGGDGKLVWTFPAGRLPYARVCAAPVRVAATNLAFVEVPGEAPTAPPVGKPQPR
ncbi:MAG: hypothetical protein IT204_08280 [Fimbriimonadaceae bacterium]|nr:hypothetical protein [Fimbriimonadaceae bacterium]